MTEVNRHFRPGKDGETGGVGLRGGCIVCNADESAANAKGASPGRSLENGKWEKWNVEALRGDGQGNAKTKRSHEEALKKATTHEWSPFYPEVNCVVLAILLRSGSVVRIHFHRSRRPGRAICS